ncbi:MAG: maleylpyruvate isomerase N-terminal domain-containing protein [Propionicimonas sp.]|uniref:maleylpyruvate isomerase N-terminal domain-containing protein n=1 Tax=Propionicimonas sp. TaxID=1955623 RepID=UPI003D10A9C1
MTQTWAEARQAYSEATVWFQEVLAQVDDRWEEPGLGEWDVRALAGHTSRSFLTVESYLAVPAAAVEVESARDYYLAISGMSAGADIAQRGRDAGRALGDDPVAAVAELARRVLALLADRDGEELPTTIAGGMRLRDFVLTRVLELTVHTSDLAVALGIPVEPPGLPARLTLTLIADLAVAGGRAGDLLLASTGRRALPDGFTVL